jgi:hypothetical protein
VAETLSSAGYTSFVELARAGGIAAPEDDAVLTILAPTNAVRVSGAPSMRVTARLACKGCRAEAL